jgi:hypothetical protein
MELFQLHLFLISSKTFDKFAISQFVAYFADPSAYQASQNSFTKNNSFVAEVGEEERR